MKFRNTEKKNKCIIIPSSKRKVSQKKIVKKNTQRTFIKKKFKPSLYDSLASLTWSIFCPKSKKTQNKKSDLIKKNYELKLEKEKIKNKTAGSIKTNYELKSQNEKMKNIITDHIKKHNELKSQKENIQNKTIDTMKTNYRLKLQKENIQNKPTQILKSIIGPKKEKKEKKTFILRFNKNTTKKKVVHATPLKKLTKHQNRKFSRSYYRDNDIKRHQYKSPEREMQVIHERRFRPNATPTISHQNQQEERKRRQREKRLRRRERRERRERRNAEREKKRKVYFSHYM